jgi:ligand-binding SRPBCC domain-containing protein
MIEIRRNSAGWSLSASQVVPADIEEVFQFFSDAENLDVLTPPWVHFQLVSPRPVEMQTGTLIDYELRLRKIPIRWRSEITDWQPPFRFVDVQLNGPYRVWIHTHLFEPLPEGTRILDHVHYNVWGGRFVNAVGVKRDLLKVFAFRAQALQSIFGS